MSSSPPDVPLHDLARLEHLDRSRLTLFVCGPGQGEAVLVALPGRGWLVLDGAGVGQTFPAHSVLDRFRAHEEPIDAVLLTHPHRDHYRGFVELLDHATHGPFIESVGCLCLYFADRSKSSAELEIAALEGTVDPDNSLHHLGGGARKVLERIRDEWERRPSRVLALVSGLAVPVTTGAASVCVLAPDVEGAAAFFRESGLASRIGPRANDLSAVVEVLFGDTRLVLGGDLPELHGSGSSGSPVATGWRRVCAQHGPQTDHTGAKIPHHGSREALADCLVLPVDHARAWVVSPYNADPKLPSFEPGDGVDVLLAAEPELHLTAMPRRWKAQSPLAPRTARAGVVGAAVPGVTLPPGFSPATPAGNPPNLVAEDCVWALVFDDAGALLERYRGRGSTLVER